MNAAENDHRRPIARESSFSFSCTSCGECCRGEIEIHLNLSDLQKMAAFLGVVDTGRLFIDGWVGESPLQEGGFRPVIRFRRGPHPICPFLENHWEETNHRISGYCRLHPVHKPLVCRLAPLGRELGLPDEENWFFTEPISGCPGCRQNKQNLVSDWIRNSRMDLDLECMYFAVLESLQKSRAPIDAHRRFHRSLKVGEDITDYLEQWTLRDEAIG